MIILQKKIYKKGIQIELTFLIIHKEYQLMEAKYLKKQVYYVI